MSSAPASAGSLLRLTSSRLLTAYGQRGSKGVMLMNVLLTNNYSPSERYALGGSDPGAERSKALNKAKLLSVFDGSLDP